MAGKKQPVKSKGDNQAQGIGRRRKSKPTDEVSTDVSSVPPLSSPAQPSAYDIFNKTIKRAENLINIHEAESECEEHHYDSFRAAVVLSISALDAYVRTLVVEKVLQKLSDKNKPIADDLKGYIKSLLNHDDCFEAGRKYEFQEKVEKAIRADFETKSFQGEYKINFYMGLAGHKDIFEEVSHSANRNKERLRGDIEKFTKRRHVIAHCGDFNLNQIPHSEHTIERSYAAECIQTVSLFAEHIHKITSK